MTTPHPQPDSSPPDVEQLEQEHDENAAWLLERIIAQQARIAELEVALNTLRGTLDGAKRIISTLLGGTTHAEYRAAQAFIRGELTERERQDIAQAREVEY